MHRFIKNLITVVTTIAMVAVLGGGMQVSTAFAQFNKEINYQGKLADSNGSTVADGSYDITFRLYDASTGGTQLWDEVRASSGGDGPAVSVSNGLFSVRLGRYDSLANVDFDQELWLSLEVESDGEMTPRKKLTSVPSAIEAENAQTVGGVASSSLFRSDTDDDMQASSSATLMEVIQDGAGEIARFVQDNTVGLIIDQDGDTGVGTTTTPAQLTVQGDGSDDIQEWFNSSGDSVATIDDQGNVGVGSSSPTAALTVEDDSGGSRLSVGSSTQTDLFVGADGNVGIGTDNPGFPLLDVRAETNSTESIRVQNDATDNYSASGYIASGPGSGEFAQMGYVNSGGAGGALTSLPSAAYLQTGDNASNGLSFIVQENTAPIRFAQNGVDQSDEIARFDSSGNLGIGTTSPASKLAVSGNILGTGNLQIGGDTINDFTGTGLSVSSNSLQVDDVDSQPTSLATGSIAFSDGSSLTEDNANFYWDDTNNRLGIGTSSPGDKLNIVDDSSLTDIDVLNTNPSGISALTLNQSGSEFFQISYQNSNFSSSGEFKPDRAVIRTGVDATNGMALMTQSPAPILFLNGGTDSADESMRVTGSGDLGIGTTSPVSRLAVSGTTTADAVSVNGDEISNFTGSNLSVTDGTLNAATGASGEANTASNLGTGADIFAQKDGVDLEFKSLLAGSNVALSTSTTGVTIDATDTNSTTSPSGNDGAIQFNNAGSFGGDTSKLYWDDTNDELGIGTNNPEVAMEVQNNKNANAQMRIENTSGGDNASADLAAVTDNNGALRLSRTGSGFSSSLGLLKSDMGLIYTNNATNGISFIADETAPIRFGTGGYNSSNERLRITGTGNIGIGTSSPVSKLAVSGTTTADAVSVNGDEINNFTGTGLSVSSNALQVDDVDSQPTSLATGSVAFSDGSTLTEDNSNFYWDDTNNRLGIGTSSPSQALQVAGNINISETDSYQINGNDFVEYWSGNRATAIGVNAGADQDTLTAVGEDAAASASGDHITAFGVEAGQSNSATNQVAVGYQAGKNNSGINQVAVGSTAGKGNNQPVQTVVGFSAGGSNTGYGQSAFGFQAGNNNSGDYSTAVGRKAGVDNNKAFQSVFGDSAGNSNTGGSQTAVGYYAGFENIGDAQTVLGVGAGYQNSGNYLSALGVNAASSNSGDYVTAVGNQAGTDNSGNYVTGLGAETIDGNTYDSSIAVGYKASTTASNQFTVGSATSTGNGDITEARIGVNSQDNYPLIYANQTGLGLGTTTPSNRLQADGTANITGTTTLATNGGNVGIGTDSPLSNYKLEINQDTNGGTQMRVVNQSTGDSSYSGYRIDAYENSGYLLGFGENSTSFGGGLLAADQLSLYANPDASAGLNLGAAGSNAPIKFTAGGTSDSAERMRITSSGNIGIGTTSPSSKLAVSGTTTADAVSVNGDEISDFTGTGLSVSSNALQVDDVDSQPTSLATGSVAFSDGSTLTEDNSNFFWDDSNDFLGLGTADPSRNIDISEPGGPASIRALSGDSAAYSTVQVGQGSPSNTQGIAELSYLNSGQSASGLVQPNRALLRAGSGASNGLGIVTSGSSPIVFGTDGLGSSNERLRITSDGNVGIGTSSPNYQLDVAGTANISNRIRMATSGPLLIGRDHGASVGDESVAIGKGARTLEDSSGLFDNNHPRATVIGYEAGHNTSGDGSLTLTAQGYKAGRNNSGSGLQAFGNNAGQNNSGDSVVAIGGSAALENSGSQTVAIGDTAGYYNAGDNVTAIGYKSAEDNIGPDTTAVGRRAAENNTGTNTTAIGEISGYNNTGEDATLIGGSAGFDNTGDDVTAVGLSAAVSNTQNNVTAIGANALRGDNINASNMGARVTGIGAEALRDNTGTSTTALGYNAGGSNTGDNSVLIGRGAGENNATDSQFIVQQANVNSDPLIQGDFASGNVGVGTTSPYAKLSVAGTSSAERFEATATSATSTFAGGISVNDGSFAVNKNTGQTDIDNLELGATTFGANAGNISWTDLPVTADASAGVTQAYTAQIDGQSLLSVFSESDGSGGIQNKAVGIGTSSPVTTSNASTTLSVNGNFFVGGDGTGTSTITDSLNVQRNLKVGTSSLLLDDSSITNTAGNLALQPNGNNNLGIGTTSAPALFTLQGKGTSSNTSFNVLDSNGRTVLSAQNNGSVGIGTEGANTTIGRKLEVSSNANDDKGIVINNESSGSSAMSTAWFTNNTIAQTGYVGIGSTGHSDSDRAGRLVLGVNDVNDATSNEGVTIEAPSTDGDIRFYTGGDTERMRISPSGDVGLGTTSPVSSLAVSGTTTADAVSVNSDAINDFTGTGLSVNSNALQVDDVDSQPTSLATGSVAFSDGSTLTEDNSNFYWDDTNDRLGIGTSSPKYQLDVAGTANISNRIRMATSGPLLIGSNHASSTGSQSTAIGKYARALPDSTGTLSENQPRSTMVGYEAGKNSKNYSVTAVGAEAAKNNSGSYVTALGRYSADENSGGDVTTVGYLSGGSNTKDNLTAVGHSAGLNNTGSGVAVLGFGAGQNNTGGKLSAFGSGSAVNNSGSEVSAFGNASAFDNTGSNLASLGFSAARNNTKNNVTAIGANALRGDNINASNMGARAVGIGAEALRNSTGDDAIGIGYQAGNTNSYDSTIVLGNYASTTAANQFVVGSDTNANGEITEARIGANTQDSFPLIYANRTGLGLGTTNPSTRLDVAGSSTLRGDVTIGTSSADQPNTALQVQQTGDDTDPVAVFDHGGATGYKEGLAVGEGTSFYDTNISLYEGSEDHVNIEGVRWGNDFDPHIILNEGGGNVGVGAESDPASQLSVSGGASIGSTYDTTTAPSDGLLVEGNVGIGTSSPETQFQVSSSSPEQATSTFDTNVVFDDGGFSYDASSNETNIDNLALGATNFESDAGVVSWVDMPVTASSSAGTENSYTAQLDGQSLLTVFSESDGSGGIQNKAVGIGTSSPTSTANASTTLAVNGNFFVGGDGTGTSTITDSLNVQRNLKVGTSSLLLDDSSITNTSGDLALQPNGNNNLGIGTTSPSTQITVGGGGNLSFTGSGAQAAIGQNQTIYNGTEQILIGNNTAVGNASGTASIGQIAIGNGADASINGEPPGGVEDGNIAIGKNARANGKNAITIGVDAQYTGGDSTGMAIGSNASAGSGNNPTAVGNGATAGGNQSTAFSNGATANGSFGVAIGQLSNADGNSSVSLGQNADATANSAIAIGRKSDADFQDSIGIGRDADPTAANQLKIGSSGYPIEEMLLGVQSSGDPLIYGSSTGVAIGTTSPNTDLEVAGNASITGTTTLATNGGRVSVGTSSPGARFSVNATPVSVNQDQKFLSLMSARSRSATQDTTAQVVRNTIDPNGSSSQDYSANRAITRSNSRDTANAVLLGTQSSVVGADADIRTAIGTNIGVAASEFIGSGTTINNAYGAQVEMLTTPDSTIKDSAGIAIDKPRVPSVYGPGDYNTTNNYTNLLLGTTTIPSGDYALYSESQTPSYLAGNVGIGTSSPNYQLDVAGTANISNRIRMATSGPILIGNNQGSAAGDEGVAIGKGARVPSSPASPDGSDPQSTAVGYEALNNPSAPYRVTAIGYQAARATDGYRITAVGSQAAENNTKNDITAVGQRAGRENTGDGLSALGYNAGRNNTADRLSAFGHWAGERNTGTNVTALGYFAGQDNTADGLTAVGERAGKENSKQRNTAIGANAIRNDTLNANNNLSAAGASSTAVGYSALRNNQGDQSVGVGLQAGANNTGNDLTANGYRAAINNTGSRVTAVGSEAAEDNTGDYLTANGFFAGWQNTGNQVAANGYSAAAENTGNYLTANGVFAAAQNTQPSVTAVGRYAVRGDGLGDTSNMGARVTGIGAEALRDNTGTSTTALGYNAGGSNTGDNSVLIGRGAGANNSTANQFILQQANVNATPLIQGDFGTGNLGIGTTSPVSKLAVSGTTTAQALSVNGDEISDFTGNNLSVGSDGVLDASGGGGGSSASSSGAIQLSDGSGGFEASGNAFNYDQANNSLQIGATSTTFAFNTPIEVYDSAPETYVVDSDGSIGDMDGGTQFFTSGGLVAGKLGQFGSSIGISGDSNQDVVLTRSTTEDPSIFIDQNSGNIRFEGNPGGTTNSGTIVEFESNSNNIIDITADGSVGIGTTSPVSKLAVSGTSTLSGNVQMPKSSDIVFGSGYNQIESGASEFNIDTTGSINLSNTVSGETIALSFTAGGGADAINVEGNGNVGLGKLDATSQLDVAGTTTADAISVNNDEISDFTGNNLSVGSDGVLDASGGGGSPGGSDGQVQFNSSGSLAGSSNFYWDDTNNRLGIGTNAPAVALDVDGAIESGTGDASSGDDTAVALGDSAEASGSGGAVALGNNVTASGGTSLGSYSIGNYTTASGNASMALGNYIEVSGESSIGLFAESDAIVKTLSQDDTISLLAANGVGIGTTSPSTQLEVVGTSTFNGDKISDFTGNNLSVSNGTLNATGGSPGGSDGQVQFNSSGSFAGSSNFFWDNSNNRLGIGTNAPAAALDVDGAIESGTSDASSGDSTSVALGKGTEASGIEGATALGETTTASGNYGATALGFFTRASGNYGATAVGQNALADGQTNMALGYTVNADGGTASMVIGSGDVSNNNYLTNTTDHSLMVGFQSTQPQLFVGTDTVGIGGATSSSSALDVAGTTTADALNLKQDYIKMDNTSGGGKIDFLAGSIESAGASNMTYSAESIFTLNTNTNGFASGDTSVFDLNSDSADVFDLTASDNIGIGTTSPVSKLAVDGDITTTGLLDVDGTGTSTIESDIDIDGSIVPRTDNTDTLGTPSLQWKDVYIGPGSLYVNGQKVLQEQSQNIVVSADQDQTLQLQTSGTGDVNLNPTGTGQIQMKGNVEMSSGLSFDSSDNSAVDFDDGLTGGNLKLAGNALSATNTNGSIEIAPDGTGNTYTTNGHFGIGTTTPATKLDVAGTTTSQGLNITDGGIEFADGSVQTTAASGGGGSAASSSGAIQFSDGSGGFLADDANFLWDDSNNRLGIGTNTPVSALDVAGTTTADAINIDGNEITSFAGSNLSVDSSGVLNASGGSGSPGGSDGQVQFNSSGSFTGSSNFFWDSINSRLGIGTNDPIADLDVNGNLSLSGTDRYINFGNATSSSGYGIRDNSGNLQFKDSGNSWTNFAAAGTSTPTFLKLTTSDSTTDMNTGSFTPVPFDTNAIDEADGLIDHSTTTNNTRISVDSDGYYRVTFNAGLETTVERPAPEFLIRKNGSTVLSDDLARHTYVRNSGGHSESSANFSTIVNLSAGDYIEVGGRFASGDSGEVTLDGNTSLTIERFVQGGPQGPQGPQGPEGAGATDIANDGSTVVTEVDKVNFGSNLSVLDDGGGNVTVSGASASIENVNGQTYTGSFIINSTGNKNITGLPFAPDQIEFKAALPVDAENVGAKAGDDSNDDSGFAGTMFGFARKSDGIQKAVTTGGSGNSINNIRFGSSNGNAIYAAYGDQNANDTGQITGSVSSWNSDGVTLNVSEYSRLSTATNGLVVQYTAYRSESIDGVVAGISDDGTEIAASSTDISFDSGLSVTDDGDGTVSIDSLWSSTSSDAYFTGGNVGIGTSTPDSKLTIADGSGSIVSIGRNLNSRATIASNANIRQQNAVGCDVVADAQGLLTCAASDKNLKTDLGNIADPLDRLDQIEGKTFRFESDSGFGTSTRIGFTAQDVQQVFPELVRDTGEYKTLDYGNMTAVLAEAIKDLNKKVESQAASTGDTNTASEETTASSTETTTSSSTQQQATTTSTSTDSTAASSSSTSTDTQTDSGVITTVTNWLSDQATTIKNGVVAAADGFFGTVTTEQLVIDSSPATSTANGDEQPDSAAGSGKIAKSATTTTIFNDRVATTSQVIVTMTGRHQGNHWINKKQDKFSVNMSEKQQATTTFDYIVIGVKDASAKEAMASSSASSTDDVAGTSTLEEDTKSSSSSPDLGPMIDPDTFGTDPEDQENETVRPESRSDDSGSSTTSTTGQETSTSTDDTATSTDETASSTDSQADDTSTASSTDPINDTASSTDSTTGGTSDENTTNTASSSDSTTETASSTDDTSTTDSTDDQTTASSTDSSTDATNDTTDSDTTASSTDSS